MQQLALPRSHGTKAPIRFVIFVSYGNDSIALLQWAHENNLQGVAAVFTEILPPQISSDLDRLYLSREASVVGIVIAAKVHPPMAVRAKSDDKAGIIRASIGQSPNVMRFQVGYSVGANEGKRGTASFAVTIGAGDPIVPDGARSLYNLGQDSSLFRWWVRSAECHFKKRSHVECGHLLRVYPFIQVVHWAEVKHEGVPNVAQAAQRLPDLVSFADHIVCEFDTLGPNLKQENALAVLRMLRNSAIALLHLHVADLAFTVIFENAVRTPAIRIAVALAGLASENEDYIGAGRVTIPPRCCPLNRGWMSARRL